MARQLGLYDDVPIGGPQGPPPGSAAAWPGAAEGKPQPKGWRRRRPWVGARTSRGLGPGRLTAGPRGRAMKMFASKKAPKTGGRAAAKMLAKTLGVAIPGGGALMSLWALSDLLGLIGDANTDDPNLRDLQSDIWGGVVDPRMLQAQQDNELMGLATSAADASNNEAGYDEIAAILSENLPVIQQLSQPGPKYPPY